MGDLDSLNIRITASAGDASRAIDALIEHLTKLNGALNNFRADSAYMKGLNNLVSGLRELRINLNGLDAQKTKDVAKAMKDLAKAGEGLAKLNGLGAVTDNMTKGGDKLFAFSEKARKEAERLAKEFNFDDKGGVDELAQAIENLYASVGDDDEVRKSMRDIDALIETYARYENELHEVAKAKVEAIRSTHGKLNSDWQEHIGGDYESARRNRAKLGINNTSKQGGSAGSIIGENTNITGIHEAADESENLALALEILEQNAYDAENAMVGFHEVSEAVSGGLSAIRSAADELVTSLGMDAEKLREMSSAASEIDDFMNIDVPDDEFAMFGTAAATAAPSVEKVAQAEEQVAVASENVAQIGNPFAGLVEGLRSLVDIHPSDSLANLAYIKDTVSKIGGDMGAAAGASLTQISNGLKSFEGVDIPEYGDKLPNLAKGLRALGTGNVVAASQSLPYVAEGLRELNSINITADVERIAQLAYAVSRFGLANIEHAIVNIPPLASSLNSLITTLSKAPAVSDSTVRLVEAISHLNGRSIQSANGVDKLSGSMRRYVGHAKKAHSATKSLAAVIGKIYASYWLLFRGISKIGSAITLASDLREVQNVVDVTFADMNEKMNEFAQNAVDTLGMSELTAKQIGSKFQAMGSAMGISKEMAKNTNDFVQTATKGYADVADSMADISINLTKLAGDMASFYNQDYEEVAEKLQAVFTGQTRPLRTYGLDLTQATLKEWALKNGLDANIKSMTQAEKTLLRYQYVLANTTAAHGDFERTVGSWANQVKIAKERIKQLGIVLGQIAVYTFKPLVSSFNDAMKRIIELATKTLNALGKIFGWQIEWSDAGVLKDEGDAAGEIADDMGDAADNAKKFKNFLLGIDELNLLPDNSDKDKGKGGAGGIGAGLGDLEGGLKIKPIEKGFESLYDTLYKLGKRIAEVIKDWLKNIDWDAIYKKARRFGKGLAQFLNGYLADAEYFYEKGRFIANGINTIAHAIDAFFKEFNGWQLGVDIGSYINGFTKNLDWGVIRSAAYEMAHDIAQTINGAFVTIDWKMVGSTIANGLNTVVDFFYTLGDEIEWGLVGRSLAVGLNSVFTNFDFAKLGQGLGKWAKGLLDAIIEFLDKVDWEQVGESIGTFIANIDLAGVVAKLGVALWKAINAAIKTWSGMLQTAPITTALVTVFASRNFRNRLGNALSGLARFISGSLSKDLGSLFSGQLFSAFGSGFMAAPLGGNAITSATSGIVGGLNAVSASLTTVTKIAGTAVVALGEFAVIENSIYKLVYGTDDLAESIGKISVAAGVAGIALSALLGVPAGLIVAGATAAVAALVGVSKAMDQIKEDNIISVLSDDLSGLPLNTLATNFQTAADDITGSIVKMNGEHDKLVSMRTDLSGMVAGLSMIGDAAKNGTRLSEEAVHELVGNLDEIKNAWEDYINSQYDYLIQATLNNKLFITSQRDLTAEEAEYFTNTINSLTEAKNRDIEASKKLSEEADEAWTRYWNAVKGGEHIPASELNELHDAALEASNAIVGLAESTGVISDERVKSLRNELKGLEEVTSDISFPSIDTGKLDDMAIAIVGDMETIGNSYSNAKDEIDEYRRSLEAEGKRPEDAEFETAEYYRQLGEYASNALDSVQLSLLDKFYKILATGDYSQALKYSNQVIKPFVDSFPSVIDEEGNKIKPYIGETIDDIMSNSFYLSQKTAGTLTTYTHELSSQWRDVFWKARDEVAPSARKAGEDVAKPFGEGIKSESEKASKNFSDVSKSTKELGKAASGSTDNLNNVQYAMSDVNGIARTMKSGVVDLGEAFGKMANEGKNVSQTAAGMKAVDDTIRQFSSQLPVVQSGFVNLSTTMQTNLLGLDVSFKRLYADIMANGQRTIAWFTSSFVPIFSASYWSNILSGIPIAFQNAFTLAFNNAKQMWMQFAQWANQNMKMDISAQKNSKGGSEVKMQFPMYEKGGFPEDGLFFANHSEMVGQFANGRTAVANNEQITDGIERAVYRAMSEVMSNVGSQPVNVELRGDAADFFTAMVNENNRAIMRTGSSPIRV